MDAEVPELVNLSQEDSVTLGEPHPGLTVFQLENALKYFNKESILNEALQEDDVQLYLEEKNTCFAVEKIFNSKMALVERYSTSFENPTTDIAETSVETDKGLLSRHAQLIKQFRLDLSLQGSDLDSSVYVSMSPSVKKSPFKNEVETTTNTTFDRDEVFTPIDEDHEKTADLVSIFLLMSILPEPAATKCKQVLDRDQFAWKITLYDVVLVLLNWGVTLQSLGLQDIFDMPTHLISPQLTSPQSPKTKSVKSSFPSSSNVILVLHSISERISPEVPCNHRALLVKVMVYAALDNRQRCYLAQYCHAINAIIDSSLSWSSDEANEIVNLLQFNCMGLQNSVFVCCSLFNMTSNRLSLIGLLGSHKVLHQHFELPAESSFSKLIRNLISPSEFLKKYKLWHVYIVTCHLQSLLIRNVYLATPCAQEVVAGLNQWTVEMRTALTQHPYTYVLASTHVRERLSRLSAECAKITRTVYGYSANKIYSN